MIVNVKSVSCVPDASSKLHDFHQFIRLEEMTHFMRKGQKLSVTKEKKIQEADLKQGCHQRRRSVHTVTQVIGFSP